MPDKKPKPLGRRILRSLILFCLLLLFIAFGVSYARGWISFHRGDGTFTILIRTGKAQQDTGHAVKKSKDATVETGKVLQRAGKTLEGLGQEAEVPPSDSSPVDKPATTDIDKSTTSEINEPAPTEIDTPVPTEIDNPATSEIDKPAPAEDEKATSP